MLVCACFNYCEKWNLPKKNEKKLKIIWVLISNKLWLVTNKTKQIVTHFYWLIFCCVFFIFGHLKLIFVFRINSIGHEIPNWRKIAVVVNSDDISNGDDSICNKNVFRERKPNHMDHNVIDIYTILADHNVYERMLTMNNTNYTDDNTNPNTFFFSSVISLNNFSYSLFRFFFLSGWFRRCFVNHCVYFV